MEDLTLGQISLGIAFFVALIGGIGVLISSFKKLLTTMLAEQFAELKLDIEKINTRLANVDMASTKNFLVRCIRDYEAGEQMSDTETERFWEQYEHYCKNGGNSYIKRKVEQLKADGKI